MRGQAIGAFRVLDHLGRGGLGEVWRAAHAQSGHEVAIKLLHPQVSALPVIPACLDEVRKASRLADTNLAKVYEAGTHTDGRVYVISELVTGESFAQRIKARRMSSTEVADVVLQITRALTVADAAGFAHRDLKPTNLFIAPDPDRPGRERVIVVDFCFGRVVSAMPGSGSLAYMAPEQITGGATDPRTDAYAVGCVAFELIAQRPPFVSAQPGDLRDKQLREAPPSLRAFAPDIGPVVDKLIGRMLEKRPADRPRSLRDLGKLFEMIVGYDAPLGETVKT